MKRLLAHMLKPSTNNGDVLTTVDGKAAWSTPAGGSGAGGGDVRWLVPAGHTSIDEFNDGTLNPSWTRVDGTGAPASGAIWAEGADVLSYVQASGDTSGAAGHALTYPLGTSVAVGDAFTAGVQMLVPATANYPSFGIILADGTTFGSGNQVFGGLSNSSGAPEHQVTTWAMTGFNNRAALTNSTWTLARGTYIHLRLVCVAANTWRTDVSVDGVGWGIGVSQAKTLTPTRIGFFGTTFGQNGTKFAASIDYLRRESGVS